MRKINGYLIDKYMDNAQKIELAWIDLEDAVVARDIKKSVKYAMYLHHLYKKVTIPY